MKTATGFAAAALALLSTGLLAQSTPLPIRQIMQDSVNPAILAVWDIGNNAMSEDGGIDPAQMDDAKWNRLEAAATQLADASRTIAAADRISAAAPENSEISEGEISMADVQRYIDNDLDGLKELALQQAAYADRLAAAASARDAATAGDLVAGMDQACENCHLRYWYPET